MTKLTPADEQPENHPLVSVAGTACLVSLEALTRTPVLRKVAT
jgi:hypothetical protein